MQGNYTKTGEDINISGHIKWHTDDSNSTIKAECNGDIGGLVSASTVISAMPALGTFGSKGAVILSFYKEAAKLSLNITDEDIT